jgi:hypothetical protein
MISEVDIRDWEHKISAARHSISSIETTDGPDVALDSLWTFITDVEKYFKGNQPQVAALFKPVKDGKGIPFGEIKVIGKGYAPQRGEGTE